MKKRERNIHEMLTSVAGFAEGNVGLFPKNSSKIREAFTSDVKDLTGLLADFVASETTQRAARQARDAAFQSLKSDLDAAALLSVALGNRAFMRPRSGSMIRWVHVGRAFLQICPSMKKDFIEHGFPADFAEQLEAKVEKLATCIGAYKAARGSSSAVNQHCKARLTRTLGSLAHMDVVALHALKDNVEARAKYDAARAVRRVLSTKKAKQETAPPAELTAVA
jgi:hypothetical protein